MRNDIYKKVNNSMTELNLKYSLYPNTSESSKGVLLYFHGGGLLYGNRDDLPKLHIDQLNNSGYSILSFDYRLAPEAKFDLILEDVLDAVKFYINNRTELGFSDLPYFLWGRSAGAYLALLASTKGLTPQPNGIVSYYGYGFTVPNWFDTSSIYYLKYPKINKEEAYTIVQDGFIVEGDIYQRYPLYIYARQTGNWIPMISEENETEFLRKYSLLNQSKDFDFPPTFLAHNFKDEDVPFMEAIELSKIIKGSTLFTCSAEEHDFDRKENSKNTMDLLNKTIDFLDNHTI